jgi:YgiT-type zinc finger domain-containing protein
MSLSHQKEAPTSKYLPCPECGKIHMAPTTETFHLPDGLMVRKIPHYKCRSCGSRFFDDDAIHQIQSRRVNSSSTKSAC